MKLCSLLSSLLCLLLLSNQIVFSVNICDHLEKSFLKYPDNTYFKKYNEYKEIRNNIVSKIAPKGISWVRAEGLNQAADAIFYSFAFNISGYYYIIITIHIYQRKLL